MVEVDVEIEDDSSDISEVSVVFESSLGESLLFAELSNLFSVIKLPDIHLEKGVSDLRESDEVELEDLGLPDGVFGSVLGHAVAEEAGQFLDSVELEEDFSEVVVVSTSFGSLLGKVQSSFRVGLAKVFDHGGPVGLDSGFSSKSEGLVDLSGFNEGLDLDSGVSASFEDRESELRVEFLDKVTKIFSELELVTVDPSSNEVSFSLGNNRSDKFNRLKGVESDFFEEGLEVDKDGLGLSGDSLGGLEFSQSVSVSEGGTWRLSADSSSTGIVASLEKLSELIGEDVFGTSDLVVDG